MHGITRPEKASKRVNFDQFTISAFAFSLRLRNAVKPPRDPAELFHRLIGRALRQTSPSIGRWLYHPPRPDYWEATHKTPAKPFLIIPPAAPKDIWRKNEQIHLGITLFGNARQHINVIYAALETLGSGSGLLGNKQGRFHIDRLEQLTLTEPKTLFANNSWITEPDCVTAADIITNAPAADAVTLELLTPMQIRKNGELITNAPPLTALIERIIGRANTLSTLYCGGLLTPPHEKTALAALARTAAIEADHTRPLRPGSKLGGITGNFRYRPIAPALIPWLALGQWIGVGGKTSYGLGMYSMETTK